VRVRIFIINSRKGPTYKSCIRCRYTAGTGCINVFDIMLVRWNRAKTEGSPGGGRGLLHRAGRVRVFRNGVRTGQVRALVWRSPQLCKIAGW
jgi:hypothetical protein